MRARNAVVAASCAVVVSISGLARADEPVSQDRQPVAGEGLGQAVSIDRLVALRGGSGGSVNISHVRNESELSGTVVDNAAINVVTGSNTIGAGAFANASGLPMAIQNSGNNVLIQNSTIVNIQMH